MRSAIGAARIGLNDKEAATSCGIGHASQYQSVRLKGPVGLRGGRATAGPHLRHKDTLVSYPTDSPYAPRSTSSSRISPDFTAGTTVSEQICCNPSVLKGADIAPVRAKHAAIARLITKKPFQYRAICVHRDRVEVVVGQHDATPAHPHLCAHAICFGERPLIRCGWQ